MIFRQAGSGRDSAHSALSLSSHTHTHRLPFTSNQRLGLCFLRGRAWIMGRGNAVVIIIYCKLNVAWPRCMSGQSWQNNPGDSQLQLKIKGFFHVRLSRKRQSPGESPSTALIPPKHEIRGRYQHHQSISTSCNIHPLFTVFFRSLISDLSLIVISHVELLIQAPKGQRSSRVELVPRGSGSEQKKTRHSHRNKWPHDYML